MPKAETKEEALLRESDDAANVLLNQALNDAMTVLQAATEAAEGVATDETANTLLNKAVEDAKLLIRTASKKAKELLSLASETAETLLARVKQLEGIIPICMYCKEIRDDAGYWNKLEEFISEHSGAEFSHGICPDCMQKHYPKYLEKPPK